MPVYENLCANVATYTCLYTISFMPIKCRHLKAQTDMYLYIHLYMYLCIHLYIYLSSTHLYIHLYTHMYTHICIYIPVQCTYADALCICLWPMNDISLLLCFWSSTFKALSGHEGLHKLQTSLNHLCAVAEQGEAESLWALGKT